MSTVPVSFDVHKIFKTRLVIKEISFLGSHAAVAKIEKLGAAIFAPNLLDRGARFNSWPGFGIF